MSDSISFVVVCVALSRRQALASRVGRAGGRSAQFDFVVRGIFKINKWVYLKFLRGKFK